MNTGPGGEGQVQMKRLDPRLAALLCCSISVAACGDDSTVHASADGSASATDSSGISDSASASASDTDSAGDATHDSGAMSATQGSMSATTGTESESDSNSQGSVDDTGSSSDTDSSSATDSDSDSAGTDTDDGPGPEPNEFPGFDQGFCDEPGALKWCYTGAPTTHNVGICHPGVQECIAIDLDLGQWGPCEDEQTPQIEVCDGLDNDCDGQTDEDQGVTNCGLGLCNHNEPNCVDGHPNDCDPFQGAEPEVCDGLDNDCDGDIDEGLGDNTISCGLGVCEHDVTACVDGEEPTCDPFEGATTEVCDGLDNDCDGETDEDLPDLHCGLGQCEHDVPSCIGGVPQQCDPFQGATTEICDGIDNDCDGLIDEDQGVWVCGQFECQVVVPRCIDGVPQGPETCVPEPGGPEICGDGVDNNCDGEAPPCAEGFLVGLDSTSRPIDVIWAVDSSGSMSQEMATVEAEINDFADTLDAAAGTNSLHLIADRGHGTFNICVAPPLGGNNCADNPPRFYQYDTNGTSESMVHSSNALGRTMQQQPVWGPRLQPNSHMAFIVTTDDDGDDPLWVSPQDPEWTDDCTSPLFITNNTTSNHCRWQGTDGNNYTSLAYDHNGYRGFISFMENFYPNHAPDTDWSYYSIIGNTGTTVLTGINDQYEFNNCNTSVENGDEYVKLSLYTNRQDSMISICQANWDLTGLAQSIAASVPNDTYVLEGSPPGTCLLIDPTTIVVTVNGIPMSPADWTYDAPSCTLTIVNNVPTIGDNVVIQYENF